MSDRGGYLVAEPFFTMVCARWPHVKDEYDNVVRKYEEVQTLKKRMNYALLHEASGLEGPAYGEFASFVKKVLEEDSVRRFVLSDAFDELTSKRFAASLFWHYENGQEYGKSKLHWKPLATCETCEKPATTRYYSMCLCNDCFLKQYNINQHWKLNE